MWNLKLVVMLYGVSLVACQDDIVISTQLGSIKGIKQDLDGNQIIFKFLKIPFAKPPIGELRFEKPQPYGSWIGTLDATNQGPSCMQVLGREKDMLPNKNVSEDCLHLNIYVPNDVSSTNRKSVMIWIHGGGYTSGQASFYDGTFMAISGDVIVVTIQYRLGAFGFFSKGALKGNYGLFDQIMAIQWVKDNIASFGGDARSITIFGESAGGFSVALLSIIPKNRGLFQRAILQSGTAISSYTILMKTPASEGVASYLNCTLTPDTDISISCLKKVSEGDLLAASVRFMRPSSYFYSSFAPVVDGDLLKGNPADLLANKASEESSFYRSLDIVVGTVSGEASLLFGDSESRMHGWSFNIADGIPIRFFCEMIATDIAAVAYNNISKISEAICKFYENNTDYITQSRSILNAYSDFTFHMPAIESLNIHTSDGNNGGGKRYQYIFSRPLPFTVSGPYPSWFDRAEHATDFVFQFGILLLTTSPDDFNLATSFVKYWTHFAKTGNMNVTGLPLWREYDMTSRHYINFDVPITTGQNLFGQRSNFWLTDIPAMLQGPTSPGHIIRAQTSIVFYVFCFVIYSSSLH